MSGKEVVREYPKGEDFKVIWKPAKCIHSEICVKTLPDVYRPNEKPWIQTEHADVDALKSQIDKCPSGALTYKTSAGTETPGADGISASVIAGGPLMIKGHIHLEISGETRTMEGNTAFCRCGASSNKPFCDGSHKGVGFEG